VYLFTFLPSPFRESLALVTSRPNIQMRSFSRSFILNTRGLFAMFLTSCKHVEVLGQRLFFYILNNIEIHVS
jgi:hypothetical protein